MPRAWQRQSPRQVFIAEPEKDADDDAQALEILNRPAKFFESIK
jgi:hypothetical protein